MIGETAVLPPGPYIFEVVRVVEMKVTISGHDAVLFLVKLWGYDYTAYWWVTKTNPDILDLVATWSEIEFENMKGARFLFYVKVEHYNRVPRNLLGIPLAKVIG